MTNLSYWEKMVWIWFNPSSDDAVTKIKVLYAEIIDIMNDMRKVEADNMKSWEHKRLSSIAITEAQSAQMRAVKALTWRDIEE